MTRGLREHLQKAEVEYIATHGGGYPVTFKWDTDIESHLRRIGMNIKGHIDDDIDGHKWVKVSGGIDVCLNDGFVYKEVKKT